MDQIHKRFTVEQVKFLLQGYTQGTLERTEVEEMLQINKTRFFALLKEYRRDPVEFSITYKRKTPARLSGEAEAAMAKELLREKELVENPELPITSYNYSAMRDRLEKQGLKVSATTITKRAKELDCYLPHPKKKAHDRQVITAAIGALVQHDASTHLWSPFAQEKWTLITSLDDYSRKLLYADFVEHETSWAHIQAAQAMMETYGLPLSYYVDNLRVFRFVQNRDSVWRKHVLQTDDIDPQWRQVMRLMGVDVTYALSPQAKDYDSYCTSFARSSMISDGENRRRFVSFRPGILVGASGPGGSNRQVPLSSETYPRSSPALYHTLTVFTLISRALATSSPVSILDSRSRS